MPSLHVGWALLVALGVISILRTPWRWLALAHPAITLAVVVMTANHYWLDAGVAIALVLTGWIVFGHQRRVTSTPPPAPMTPPVDEQTLVGSNI